MYIPKEFFNILLYLFFFFSSTALPTTSKNWGKIKVTIKQYLQDLLQV